MLLALKGFPNSYGAVSCDKHMDIQWHRELGFAIGGVNFGVFSMNQLQMYAVIAGIAIIFYNGQKGKYSLKWFFYAVYPVHLALLLLIRQFITAV